MALKNFSNQAVDTKLNGSITSGATSLVVDDATGYPAVPFGIVIEPGTANEEGMLVNGKSGTTFSSLTRNIFGYTAVSHPDDAPVILAVMAEDIQNIYEHAHFFGDGSVEMVLEADEDLSGTITINSTSFITIDSEQLLIPTEWIEYTVYVRATWTRDLHFHNVAQQDLLEIQVLWNGVVIKLHTETNLADVGVATLKTSIISGAIAGGVTGQTATGNITASWQARRTGAGQDVIFRSGTIQVYARRTA